ncbi:MAG: putative 4-hydroxybenzoate polyprenyltransferase [Thermaerobacter sp.]|nr:putative 4-hydroxybenzoate polyprenyltransferase [Thermaerobacter sp.]
MATKASVYAGFVKLEHTVFALPFAYAGAFLAAGGLPPWRDLVWITVAMVGARSAAMGLNRFIDREIDARNPRTADRHLPRGLLSATEALAFSLASLGVLALAAAELNRLCLELLPLAVVALVIYPYTKRFTWTCHYFLGAAQFFAPFGGWIAVTGRIAPGALILGAAVGLWVASFDLIYALQDLDFDRRHGVFSIPARFGPAAGLAAARVGHLVAFALLLSLYFYLHLGPVYLAGVVLTGLLLVYEHSLVSPRDWSRLPVAFFHVNSAVSLIYFAFLAAGMLWVR